MHEGKRTLGLEFRGDWTHPDKICKIHEGKRTLGLRRPWWAWSRYSVGLDPHLQPLVDFENCPRISTPLVGLVQMECARPSDATAAARIAG